MELTHHIKTKQATDSILDKFKRGVWLCGSKNGKDFYRTNTFSDFPAPDATFADEKSNFVVSFEFKPPTETKRGMLTGLGQAIAYLQRASVSFLIAPHYIGTFNMKDYLSGIYKNLLENIPVGLMTYNTDDPSDVEMVVNAKAEPKVAKGYRKSEQNRYWAKHQDLPLPLFYLILHYYYLKKINPKEYTQSPYAICWERHMAPKEMVENLKVIPVTDLNGHPIKTMNGKENVTYCKGILDRIKSKMKSSGEAEQRKALLNEITTHKPQGYKGTWDNNYDRVRRYILAFYKQLGMIDSNDEITEKGYKLHELGMLNGPESQVFRDYFTKEVLITGCHFDLIVDFDRFYREKRKDYETINEFMSYVEQKYEEEGHIKRNPNRKANNKNHKEFLSHERTLWKYLGIMSEDYVFNWKKIIEVCTLPDL